MLNAFIIDELQKKDRSERNRADNRLHLPVPERDNETRKAPERRPVDALDTPSEPRADGIVIDL